MDLGNLTSDYYRYNLDTSLSPARINQTRQSYIIVDSVMGVKASQYYPPQDIGELRHAPLDDKPVRAQVGNGLPLKEIDQANSGTTAEHAYRYRSFSRRDLLDSRKTLENLVRSIKRQGLECPFRNEDLCSKVFIRCGERLQFSMRETITQQMQPHKCNYSGLSRGTGVLIVDSDVRIRDFCKQTLALFSGCTSDDIVATDTVSSAIGILNDAKLYGRKFGLVIIDDTLPENGGYWLVNELFRRNYDANIILTKSDNSATFPPEGYLGDTEVAPRENFVSVVLKKPFHSETLISALEKIGYG
jgi:hypothetical protein